MYRDHTKQPRERCGRWSSLSPSRHGWGWRKATAQQDWGNLHSWPQSPTHGCQDSVLARGIEVYILLSSHFSYFKKSILCDFRMLVLCVETTFPMAVAPRKAPTSWAGIQGLHSLVLTPTTPSGTGPLRWGLWNPGLVLLLRFIVLFLH